MVKRNGKNREHLTALNVPHLGKKIKKTCANRPVSCVNGENPSDFGSDKETVYHCAAALGRRACPLRHRLRDATSPKGRGFSASFSSKNTRKSELSDFSSAILLSEQKDTGGKRNERRRAAICGRSCGSIHGGGGVPVLGGHPAGGDGRAGCRLMHSRECRETSEQRLENTNVK